MTISQWSTTAGLNASGVTGVNWAEGMPPGTVNDSARAMMADVAAWVGQASGSIPEYLTGVAGTNTITATGPAQMASYVAGQRFVFIPAATNTAATTLNITPSGGAALGARNVFWNGAACVGRELIVGVPVVLVDDGTRLHIDGNGTGLANLISVQSASASAQLDFTSLTGYTGYRFVLQNVIPATDNVSLILRISQDNGVSFKAGASDYHYARHLAGEGGAHSVSGSATTSIPLATGTGNDANEGVSGEVKVADLSTANKKHFCFEVLSLDAAASQYYFFSGGGAYSIDNTAINAVRFLFDAGNIASGVIRAYGLRP